MQGLLAKFERYIVLALLAMMGTVVLLGTIELGVILVTRMVEPPLIVLLNLAEMLELFSLFLLILVGLELIEVIKDYLREDTVHAEIVLLVAIIAVARKVVVMDLKAIQPLALVGLAAVIVALAVAYYLLKKGLGDKGSAPS